MSSTKSAPWSQTRTQYGVNETPRQRPNGSTPPSTPEGPHPPNVTNNAANLKALLHATLYHSATIPRALSGTKLKLYFGPRPSIAFTIREVSTLALGANIGINGIATFLPTGE